MYPEFDIQDRHILEVSLLHQITGLREPFPRLKICQCDDKQEGLKVGHLP